jgi:hypothetical protein
MIFLAGFDAICIEIRNIQKFRDTLPILKQIGTFPQFQEMCPLILSSYMSSSG